MRTRDVMTPDPVSVPPVMTVEALAHLLAERRASGAFVLDAFGVPLGVVAQTDPIRRPAPKGEEADFGWIARYLVDPDRAAARCARAQGTRACDAMDSGPVLCNERAPMGAAARKAGQRGFGIRL